MKVTLTSHSVPLLSRRRERRGRGICGVLTANGAETYAGLFSDACWAEGSGIRLSRTFSFGFGSRCGTVGFFRLQYFDFNNISNFETGDGLPFQMKILV